MWYQSEGPAGYGDCSDLIKVSIFRHLSTSTALVGTLSEKTVESTGYGDQMKTENLMWKRLIWPILDNSRVIILFSCNLFLMLVLMFSSCNCVLLTNDKFASLKYDSS